MLRINLLPDYIGDKNKIRNLGAVWVVAVILVAVGLLMVNSSASKSLQDAKDDRAAKEGLKATTDKNKQAIETEKSNRAVIESKQTFVLHSKQYNDGWPEVFETIRDVKPADNSIILDSMAVDSVAHQTVSLTGFGVSEIAIVRWWMSLRNNTALFEHVNFDLVPHVYAPATASTGGGMGQMGGPGSMGGMSKMGGPGAIGPGGVGSGGGGMMSSMPGMGGMRGMGGMGGGQTSGGNGPGELEGKHGINFTAAVVLKTALAGGIPTPSWAGGGGGPMQGGMGAPGPMSGGMGGGPMSGGMSVGAPMSGGGGK